jgi:two-component system response regulator FixJ
METLQNPAPGGGVPAHLVLNVLAELSAAVETMRQELAKYGIRAPCAVPGHARVERETEAPANPAELSNRQRQVLAGIVRGYPNKIIAWELGLSVRTVEAYRAQLFERLGARNAADAVRLALASGLIDGATCDG